MSVELESQPQTSVYRPIFEAIENIPDCAPIDAFRKYNEETRHFLDPSIYLSMAITSGGYARDESLSFGEALQKNNDFGSNMALAIVDQNEYIDLVDIVVPAELGKVKGWGQAEYLVFWAHVIIGIDPEEAAEIEEIMVEAGIMKLPGFSDTSLSREERWKDYEKLVDKYVDAIATTQSCKGLNGRKLPRNMHAMLLILDAQQSLGVNAERYLCHKLGFGEYVMELSKDSDIAPEIETLRQLGATSMPFIRHDGIHQTVGSLNTREHWYLREQGYKFRKPGVYAFMERKVLAQQGYVVN